MRDQTSVEGKLVSHKLAPEYSCVFRGNAANFAKYGTLLVDSIAIPCVNRIRYLGIYLLSARSFKVCWQEPKKKFF